MNRVFCILLLSLVTFLFSACAGPQKVEPKPDLEKVRQNQQEASDDLADEEDRKEDRESEDLE
jgi:hypothetical protein